MLAVRIDGSAESRRAAAQLRKAEQVTLRQETRKAQRRAFGNLQPEVKASAVALLPKRGGYNRIMARAAKVSIRVRFTNPVVTARFYARGKAELRDLTAVNRGSLRHPVFGRRRSPWRVTTVPPGFVDKVTDRIPDRVLRESADALEKVIRELARG